MKYMIMNATKISIYNFITVLFLFSSSQPGLLLAADAKTTNSTKEANTQFTKSELDALEKNLETDPNYRWKILEGDRKRTAALILAAQNRKPASAGLWAGALGMIFAQDQFEARALPEKERQERYRYALGYLQDFSQSLQSAIKANLDKPDLKLLSDSWNGSIALAALESGEQLDIAKKFAEAMLKSNTDIKSWNYGNIIYDANTILGRVALRQNDLKAARMYLLESGKTPGSPQLNSFGPRFDLDRELLKKGEKAVVLEHLELVSKFWGNTNRNDGVTEANSLRVDADHAKKLAQWKKQIEEGKTPSDQMWK